MNWQLHPKMNEKLYLRDPEQSEIGKSIIKKSIILIRKLGFEAFTFKKLAEEIPTTEATVYRYFENKHRLLSYVVAWYWHWLDYQVMFKTNNISNSSENLYLHGGRSSLLTLIHPPARLTDRRKPF